MYGKKQWKGREVEGRYSDMMTFFVRDLINGQLDLDEVITDSGRHQNYEKYPHYYFTIEYMNSALLGIDNKMTEEKQSQMDIKLDIIRNILDSTNCVVTVEAGYAVMDYLPADLFNRCHIIYRINDKNVQQLKATDTLSIDAGWYRVHQITKLNMMEISPDNYKFDET